MDHTEMEIGDYMIAVCLQVVLKKIPSKEGLSPWNMPRSEPFLLIMSS